MNRLGNVAIHQTDTSGAFAEASGTGSLVHPLLVVVHPPLGERLLEVVDPTRWRIVGDLDGVREEVAIRTIEPAEHAGEVPLVALVLDVAATSPTVGVLRDETEAPDVAAAVERHLATGVELGPGPGPGDDWRSPFCKLFPNSWFCVEPSPDPDA